MTAAARVTELPVDVGRRGRATPFKLDEILSLALAPVAPIGAMTVAIGDSERLEQLDRELALFLQEAAPATWRAHRRSFRELIQAARREIRT